MIKLTGIKGDERALNPSRIMEIKSVPDTVLVLLNGNCMLVKETAGEVIERIVSNPREFIHSGARALT